MIALLFVLKFYLPLEKNLTLNLKTIFCKSVKKTLQVLVYMVCSDLNKSEIESQS